MEGLEAHPVLLYDGDCRFCAEQAERLRRWAGGGVELESFRPPPPGERRSVRGSDAARAAGRSGARRRRRRRPPARAAPAPAAARPALRRARAPRAGRRRLPPRREEPIPLGRPHLPRGHLRRARAPVRGRAHVRTLFLRSLGLVFVAAFLSLAAQVRLLFGARGLLPACPYVARTPWWVAPSLLRFDCSDRALLAAALAGATAALGLVLDILPAGSLVLCWLLYFS